MIRLTGLVDLRPIKEEHQEVEAPTVAPMNLAAKLEKLKTHPDITPEQLAKIEAMEQEMGGSELNEEVPPDNSGGEGVPEQDHEGGMAKADLLSIHKKAGELYNMVGENDQLEGWVQEKVSLAADYINSIHSHMQYEKSKPGAVGNGEDVPADNPMGTPPANESVDWATTMERAKQIKEENSQFSLSGWMKKNGYGPQNEEVDTDETEDDTIEEIGIVKKVAYVAKAARDVVRQRGYEKDSEKQANATPRVGKNGKETAASARDRDGAKKWAGIHRNKINKRVKGIDNARGFKGSDAKVKNPETGKEILATTAAKDKDHPAHSAAKSALKK